MAQPRWAEGDGRRAPASGAGRSLGHPGWPGSGAAGRRGPPCSGWPGLGCVWSRGFYPGALQSVNLGFWMPEPLEQGVHFGRAEKVLYGTFFSGSSLLMVE